MTTPSLIAESVEVQEFSFAKVPIAEDDKGRAVTLVRQVSDLATSDPAGAEAFAVSAVARLLLGTAEAIPVAPEEALGLSVAGWPAESVGPESFRQRYLVPPGAERVVFVLPAPEGAGTVPIALVHVGEGRLVLTPDAPTFAASTLTRGWAEIPEPAARGEVRHLRRTDVDALRLLAELLRGAVEHGIVAGFLARALEHLKSRSHPWPDTGVERASEDPHVLRRVGEYIATFDALTELLDEGGRAVDDALAGSVAPADAWPEVAAARLFAIRTGKELISGTIELLGASSVRGQYGFDAFWRNFTDHAASNPPLWSVEALGKASLS